MSEYKESNYLNADGSLPIVKKNDYGIRPAGKPDECFYCHSKVGEPHKFNCVTVCKMVKLRATIDYEYPIPISWDKNRIENHYNLGTWCANNLIEDLKDYIEYIDEKDGSCLCYRSKVEVIEDE